MTDGKEYLKAKTSFNVEVKDAKFINGLAEKEFKKHVQAINDMVVEIVDALVKSFVDRGMIL